MNGWRGARAEPVTPSLSRLLWVLGGVWTLPNTAIGLAIGLAGLTRGATARRGEGAIVFDHFPWGPGGALTLGQVILNTGVGLDGRCRTYADRAAGRDIAHCATVRLGDHERAHILQYLLFGPLFLPLYLICGGISARNPLERAADDYALGGSPWPWSHTTRTPSSGDARDDG
jgi:hypothetical protein